MLKVRLLQPGQKDVEVTVEGNSVVIGRDAKCDVVVPQPYVSKRHVQILRGLVLVDLRSSNGTFVNGEKVSRPVLLERGLFNLSDRMDVAVEVSDAPPAASSTDGRLLESRVGDLGLLREQLESERARAAVLAGELAELRRSQPDEGGAEARAHALEQENRDLRRRLDALKEDVEEREVEAAASLQVRLAEGQLREVLAARLREREPRAGPALPAPDQAGELARLRAELDQARQKALPPSELFTQLHRENQELRQRLEAFESGAARSSVPASELFLQLQSENRELRRKLEELEALAHTKTRAKAAPEKGPSRAEMERVRTALQAAEGELSRLRDETRTGIRVADEGPAGGEVLALVRAIVERDVESIEAARAASVEDFLVLETLRFLRGTERVVTRAAGEMAQLYHQRTILPEMGGNFRSLTRRVLDDPRGQGARGELARYLEQLARWLVVSLGAPRKAALQFAAQLKQELSEEALTQARPMPALRIVAGQREAELWRRASEHLASLSTELIEDRIEKLSRETARELLGLREAAS